MHVELGKLDLPRMAVLRVGLVPELLHQLHGLDAGGVATLRLAVVVKQLLAEIGRSLDYSTEQIEAAATAVSTAQQSGGGELDPALIAVQIASHFG